MFYQLGKSARMEAQVRRALFFYHSLELAPDALADDGLLVGVEMSDCLSLRFAKMRGVKLLGHGHLIPACWEIYVVSFKMSQ